MKIEQVMSRPVTTCRASDVLNTAAGLMWENDCGALPVVNDEGAVIGMITDRDICMAAYTSGRNLHSISIEEAMAKKVLTCLPTDDLADAERIMATAQLRRLPVIDRQGCPIGIVSMSDIARASANGGKRTAVEALSTMAAICEPRHRSLVKAA